MKASYTAVKAFEFINQKLFQEIGHNFKAILADKGFQGATELLRAVHSKKITKTCDFLPSFDQENNRQISSDRKIVGTFFGSLCSLWKNFRTSGDEIGINMTINLAFSFL